MCSIVCWVVPVILLQALNSVEGVSFQVNAEDNAEDTAKDNASSRKILPNLQSGNSKPHIVLMVADDLGWNDVSWHNPKIHSPNLENLALTGVILNQSYVQEICTPSRSALLTGRYPFTIGRQHSVFSALTPDGLTLNATLLPQELKKLGYSTHMVGKWHLGFCNWKYTPTRRGFDTFYGFYNGDEDYFNHRLGLTPEDWDNGLDGGASSQSGYDFRNNTSPNSDVDGTYSTDVFASYVEVLLKTRNAIDPMFLYLPFQSVHRPLQVPPKYNEPFKYVKDENRRTFMGMVSAMDEAVGRIVRALKETGHYNNSVIVFITDNGGDTLGGNNWPLRGSKHTLWEGGTRGVTFVHSPLLNNRGTVSNQLVHVSDWFSTLLGVAGGNIPEGLDSIDQWEAIAGNMDPPRNRMIYNLDDYVHIKGGIRIGDYKLLFGEGGFDKRVPPPENENIKELMRHLTIDDGEQIPFTVEAIPDLGMNYSDNINTSENPRDRSSPKTFADLLTWNVVDLVNYKKLHLHLFNIKDDPTEHHDISDSNPSLVKEILDDLLLELPRVVHPSIKPDVDRGHPRHWDNLWSPGWC